MSDRQTSAVMPGAVPVPIGDVDLDERSGPRRLLAGRFKLIDVVASGAFGRVERAMDLQRGEVVALKSVRYDRPEDVRLLKREFRILKDITHPNLLPLHHLACHDGEWFFSMALVEGEPVEATASRLRDSEDYRGLARLFRGIADGLGHLHSHGIVHRDIKPSNIVVTEGDKPVLLDFGLSTRLSLEASRRSRSGTFTGSTAYAAPEQLFGEEVSPASDWFAVGMLLYQALTGVRARREELDEAVDVRRPIGFGVPDALSELTWRLLRPESERRPRYKDVVRLLSAVTETVPQPTARLGPTQIVGRVNELAILEGCRDSLLYETITVEVIGEHGHGKTHLAEAFCRDRERRGDLVLRAACRPDEHIPYNAVDGIVDDVVRFLAGMPVGFVHAVLPTSMGSLMAMFPALAELRHGRTEPAKVLDAEEAESAAMEFAAFLGALATRRPLCLFVDDIHWADRDSLRLLSAVQQQKRAGLMLVATTQPEVSVRKLSLDVGASVVVGPMRGEDAEAFAEELTRRLDIGFNAAMEAVVDGGGHPYLAELVAMRRTQNAAATTMETPAGRSEASLEAVLLEQVSALNAAQDEFISLLALARGPLALDALESALPHLGPLEPLRDHLSRQHLVGRAGGERASLRILHEPVRRVLRRRLAADPERTRRLHGRIIDALMVDHEADPFTLIHHMSEAGRNLDACQAALAASGRAESALAFHTSAKLLGLALEFNPDIASAELLWKLTGLLVNAGRAVDAGRAAVLAARRNAEDPAAEPGLALQQLAYGASQLLRGGAREEGAAVAQEVVAGVGLKWRKNTASMIASLLWQRAVTGVLPTRSPKQPAPNVLRRLDMIWDVSSGLSFYDSLLAFELQARHARMALRQGDDKHQALALATQAMVRGFEGGHREEPHVIRLLAKAKTQAAKVSDPLVEAHLRLMSVMVMYSSGHFEAVVREGIAGYLYCRDHCRGTSWERAGLMWVSTCALGKLGRFGELRTRIREGLRVADRLGDEYLATMLRLGPSALGQLAAGDAQQVIEDAKAARAMGGRSGFLDYMYVFASVRAHLYLGDVESASMEYWDAKASVTAGGMMRSPLVRLEMLALETRIALAQGAADPPAPAWATAFNKARRALGRVAHPAAESMGQLAQGQADVLAERPDAAAMSFALAATGFEAAGLPLEAGLASQLGRWVRHRNANEVLGYLKRHGIASPTKFARALCPGIRFT